MFPPHKRNSRPKSKSMLRSTTIPCFSETKNNMGALTHDSLCANPSTPQSTPQGTTYSSEGWAGSYGYDLLDSHGAPTRARVPGRIKASGSSGFGKDGTVTQHPQSKGWTETSTSTKVPFFLTAPNNIPITKPRLFRAKQSLAVGVELQHQTK